MKKLHVLMLVLFGVMLVSTACYSNLNYDNESDISKAKIILSNAKDFNFAKSKEGLLNQKTQLENSFVFVGVNVFALSLMTSKDAMDYISNFVVFYSNKRNISDRVAVTVAYMITLYDLNKLETNNEK